MREASCRREETQVQRNSRGERLLMGRLRLGLKASSARVSKALDSNVNVQHMRAKRSTSGGSAVVTKLCLSHLMSPEKAERGLPVDAFAAALH